jgi:hypothetical protein
MSVPRTSIEQVFRTKILLCKLFGHFLFDWRNRYLAIGYRSVAPFLVKWASDQMDGLLLDDGGPPEPRTASSDRIDRNFLFYETIYFALYYLAIVESILVDIRFHDTIVIILRKRLQMRYLQSMDKGQQRQQVDGNKSKPGDGERHPPETARHSSEQKAKHSDNASNINFLLATTFVLVAMLASSEVLLELDVVHGGGGGGGGGGARKDAFGQSANGAHNRTTDAVSGELELADEQQEGGASSEVAKTVPRWARLFAYFLFQVSSYTYFLYFGSVTISLFVVACLADMLGCINEHLEQDRGPSEQVDDGRKRGSFAGRSPCQQNCHQATTGAAFRGRRRTVA